MAVLRVYSSAVVTGDCEMVVKLTSAAVKRRDKYPSQFRDFVFSFLSKMQAGGVTEQLLAPIGNLQDGNAHAVFVPSKRFRTRSIALRLQQ